MDIFLKRQIFRVVHSHWALRETDLDGHENFMLWVSNAILNTFYMDGYLNFFDDVEEAVSTIKEVTSLLTFGQFLACYIK